MTRRHLDDDPPKVDAISGPNRYYIKDPNISKTGFYDWWFDGRQKQLEDTALSSRKHLIAMPSSLIRKNRIKKKMLKK